MDMAPTATVARPEPAPAGMRDRPPIGHTRGHVASRGYRDCGCGRDDCRAAFAALAETTHPIRRAALRNELVERHLGLARAITGRYHRPGPGFDDVAQVAA